ncbi:MAG: hypothetical protein ACSHXB_19090 [Sulfitobacter sp.]
MTLKICALRDEISQFWHERGIHCKSLHSGFITADRFQAFCAAKDLLQDSGEALMVHRKQGFSSDPFSAYIEFWGVMQTIVIQQDAISELEFAISGKLLNHKKMGAAWQRLRNWRHLTTGHPARKTHGEPVVARCVTGRDPKSYTEINLLFHSGGPSRHEKLRLGCELDQYEKEACGILRRQQTKLQSLIQ